MNTLETYIFKHKITTKHIPCVCSVFDQTTGETQNMIYGFCELEEEHLNHNDNLALLDRYDASLNVVMVLLIHDLEYHDLTWLKLLIMKMIVLEY
ncbi:hypothetical protein HanPI659440_Chr14g0528521 [Helianthus annuus]|nr:hypothetical protein HanPI659440_Chr14g0528521 [Helianthus annuus]